jgi:hypothetical protein
VLASFPTSRVAMATSRADFTSTRVAMRMVRAIDRPPRAVEEKIERNFQSPISDLVVGFSEADFKFWP